MKEDSHHAIRSLLSAALLVAVEASAAAQGTALAPQLKQGESVVMMPLDMRQLETTTSLQGRHILIHISDEGLPIAANDQAELLIYRHKGDKAPLARYHAQDLGRMADTTGCSAAQKALVAAKTTGYAFFCNASIDLAAAHFFVLKRPGHDDEDATEVHAMYRDRQLDVLYAALAFDDD